MKRTCLLLLALAGILARAVELQSPDGSYVISIEGMTYTVSYQGKPLILQSQLGLSIDNHLVESAMGIPVDSTAVWTENLHLTGVDRREHDSLWHPLYGERLAIRDHYREMTLHYDKGGDTSGLTEGYNKNKRYLMDIVVRAYDEGIAFRYHFPEATNGLFLHITEELTTFSFAPRTMAYHEAWAQGPFHLLPLNDWRDESERPQLLTLPDGLSVALLEAGLRDFPRGKFKLKKENELQVSLFNSADVITPYDTPWRVIMAAERPVDLINHKDLVLNLNAPADSHTPLDWIRPGRAFRCTRLDNKTLHEAIDFCADFGIEYVELDAGWYGPEMKISSDATKVADSRDFAMPEICAYAKSKGVGVWLYVNQRALYYQLDEILPLYQQWGVKGIKFGFVQIGSQQWTTWLHEAVRRCAEHGLMVDIHDEYRPTGVSRTYPNLMTQEGIRGNEEFPDATHNTILPFTRYLCGPADYTICYFDHRLKNTRGHQLAMAAVYFSPIQFLFWYDLPNAFQGEAELQFWKDCPTVFDESIALDGQPGEYIIQARRSGTDWFVGCITNTEGRSVQVPTDFLPKGKYTVEIYNDDPSLNTRTKVSAKTISIKSGKPITLQLQPSGGAALHFKPVTK